MNSNPSWTRSISIKPILTIPFRRMNVWRSSKWHFSAIVLVDKGFKLMVQATSASSGVNNFARIFNSTPLSVSGKPLGIRSRCSASCLNMLFMGFNSYGSFYFDLTNSLTFTLIISFTSSRSFIPSNFNSAFCP